MKFKYSECGTERTFDIMTCLCGNDDLKIGYGVVEYSTRYCFILCKDCGIRFEHTESIYNMPHDRVVENTINKWNNICKRLNQLPERKIMHLIDILVDMDTDIPCDYMTLIADENGENWCEKNCNGKDSPTKECWLKYLEVVEVDK